MPKTIKREPNTDAVEILRRDLIGNDPQAAAEYEQVKADLAVARKIYGLREAAGLTQAQLAQRIGTSRTVISRLEDADYEGHSLAMLSRIAVCAFKARHGDTPARRSSAQNCGAGLEKAGVWATCGDYGVKPTARA